MKKLTSVDTHNRLADYIKRNEGRENYVKNLTVPLDELRIIRDALGIAIQENKTLQVGLAELKRQSTNPLKLKTPQAVRRQAASKYRDALSVVTHFLGRTPESETVTLHKDNLAIIRSALLAAQDMMWAAVGSDVEEAIKNPEVVRLDPNTDESLFKYKTSFEEIHAELKKQYEERLSATVSPKKTLEQAMREHEQAVKKQMTQEYINKSVLGNKVAKDAIEKGIVANQKPTEGRKFDQGKLRFSLMPEGTLNKILEILEFGAQKYEENNWQKVSNPKKRYFDAAMRHLMAWGEGEKNDAESGKSHLAHAATCLVFLMWFDK